VSVPVPGRRIVCWRREAAGVFCCNMHCIVLVRKLIVAALVTIGGENENGRRGKSANSLKERSDSRLGVPGRKAQLPN
jgi:hypothetical protein